MKKIAIIAVSIYIVVPVCLAFNFLDTHSFLNHNALIVEYFKIVLPMLIPTGALLFTLSRYREEDQSKEKKYKSQLDKEEQKKKEASRPYFSIKFVNRKMQVFTASGSPVLNISIIYDFKRERIIEKGGMESSEMTNITQNDFDWLLLHAKTVQGEEIYFVYTVDTKTGSHYILEEGNLVAYSNGGDYEKSIAENYFDFIIVRREYQRNHIIGKLHGYITQKSYNKAMELVVSVLRYGDISKQEKLHLLALLSLFFNQGHYSVQKSFDRNYVGSNIRNFSDIDWNSKFTDESQDISNFFLAHYILDIIRAYQNETITFLDFILRPIEVFLRDDVTIFSEHLIRQMEKLLLKDEHACEYAKTILESLS